MNFFNLLSAGTNLFNFNLANSNTSSKNNTIITKPLSSSHHLQLESSPVCSPDHINQDQRADVFAQQQQLINQYMHLNIQLLSKKLEHLEQEKQPKTEEADDRIDLRSNKKKIKKVNTCGHSEREHYAKGMCNNCYHRFGRTKKPWRCPHSKLYANGMCQNCYINNYNKKRREGKTEEEEQPEESRIAAEINREDPSLSREDLQLNREEPSLNREGVQITKLTIQGNLKKTNRVLQTQNEVKHEEQ